MLAPFGAAADVLGHLISEAKAGDALAPVTVACPTSYAAVALRRLLGSRDGGVVNVRFATLPEVAEQLARPSLAEDRRSPVTPTVRRAAVRTELRRDPGVFGAGAGHTATEEALDRAVRALEGVPPDVRARMARTGPVASHAVRLHTRVSSRLAAHYGEAEAVAVAAAAVRADAATLDDVGALVVHLPRRLSPAEVDLVAAIANVRGAAAVVGAAEPGDAVAAELVDVLAPLLGAPCTAPPGPVVPVEGTVLVSAADPADEVRTAVRHIVGRMEGGVPLHRCAILWRLAEPYALLVHEQLRGAGLPFHGPAPARLSQSVAGRTLLGALDLAGDGLRRADVTAWMAAAPVLDPDGRGVPAARWEQLARRAGVVAGPAQWHERLAALAASVQRDLDGLSDDDAIRARRARDLDEIARLDDFVADLAAAIVPPARAGWDGLARWAATLVESYVGPPGGSRWPADEVVAYEHLLEALQRLGALDGTAPCHDVYEFRRALELETEAPSAASGFFGGGVFTGTVADAMGASFDTVVVVGMVEGAFPPEPPIDAVLDDDARRVAGGLLPRRADRRADERRSYLAAIAAAPNRMLCHARSDPRGQRRTLPARWFLEAAAALAGTHVSSALADTFAAEPWYRYTPSFQAATTHAAVPVSLHELDVQSLLVNPPDPVALSAHPLMGADATLARGFEARHHRAAVEADAWSGFVGALEGLAPSARARSATALERYAQCPFKYFLSDVLRVDEMVDTDAADAITAIDRGSMVHEILERFMRARSGRAPAEAWDGGDRARLHEIASDVLDRYEATGRTGRALLWAAEQRRIRRDLDRFLEEDSAWRRQAGVAPDAVELRFGFDDDEPVTLTLPDGRQLGFRGWVDRLDVSPDGGRAVVLDYKTGSTRGYEELLAGGATDLVCGGRHLQLPVYALAAAARYPGATVEAYFWFVTSAGRFRRAGGPIDAAARARFVEVLSVVVDGIRAGRFAARPGKRDEFRNTFEECRYCPYDRVCPADRHRRWERFRRDPGLAPYLELIGEALGEEAS